MKSCTKSLVYEVLVSIAEHSKREMLVLTFKNLAVLLLMCLLRMHQQRRVVINAVK